MSDEMESGHEHSGAPEAGRVPIEDLVRGERVVRGERGISSVSRTRSLQSRLSSVLAGGLTVVLGIGALTWYYTNALTRPNRARDSARAAAARRAQAEMPLPALGRIDAPKPAAVPGVAVGSAPDAQPVASQTAPGASAAPPVVAVTAPQGASAVLPMVAATAPPSASTMPSAVGATAARSSRVAKPMNRAAPAAVSVEARDQRLAGPVFVRQSAEPLPGVPQLDDPSATSRTAGEHGLADLLRPTPVVAVQARVLPTRRFLLPKGSFIDCTLETAIDSTLPGMTTCVVATDTFSADGSVVLLERGTRLVGETRGQVAQGTARIFVLWTEARTPTGVVVPLDSPGTDELGRSGLAGTVDRHFWERFGSAILITTIDGAVQAAVQPSAGSGGTVIYNPSASQQVLTEVLKSTLDIPPTVKKSQGDRIEILVARDVDFRSVYELRR